VGTCKAAVQEGLLFDGREGTDDHANNSRWDEKRASVAEGAREQTEERETGYSSRGLGNRVKPQTVTTWGGTTRSRERKCLQTTSVRVETGRR